MRADRYEESDSALAREEAELARARARLVLSLSALEQQVTRAFDWHEWVRRRPGTALALAFGLGLFLGRRK